MKLREKRSVVTSVRWTEDEFCRLQLYLTKTGRDSLSDLIREATLAHLNAVLHPYDNSQESNNERKERTKEKKETTKNNLCLADSRIGDEAIASTSKLKLKSLEERRQAFWNRLVPFVRQGVYPLEMVKAFYLYWTECTEKSRKMRFEMEKTYELPRRLATWRRRENKGYGITNSRNYGRAERLTPEQMADQARAKEIREEQSAEYQRYREEVQQKAISYAEYKKGIGP